MRLASWIIVTFGESFIFLISKYYNLSFLLRFLVIRSFWSVISHFFCSYESFDFHAECRHMRWDRLSILLDRLAHEQDDFSCFLLTRDGTLASIQDGVFRTNCIDCLDRTNVVQSMLARYGPFQCPKWILFYQQIFLGGVWPMFFKN